MLVGRQTDDTKKFDAMDNVAAIRLSDIPSFDEGVWSSQKKQPDASAH
jgi:hypothetical protein